MTHPPKVIAEAITRGLKGDRAAGLTLLQPLIADGPNMTYAVLAMLAEIASMPVREHQTPDTYLGLEVVSAPDGRPATVDDMPAPLRFAAQFMTTQANGDRQHTYALFDAFTERCVREETTEIGDAVVVMYDMAVASTQEFAQHGRRSA